MKMVFTFALDGAQARWPQLPGLTSGGTSSEVLENLVERGMIERAGYLGFNFIWLGRRFLDTAEVFMALPRDKIEVLAWFSFISILVQYLGALFSLC